MQYQIQRMKRKLTDAVGLLVGALLGYIRNNRTLRENFNNLQVNKHTMHNIPNLLATQKVAELEGSVELEDLAAYDRGKGNYHIRICTKMESVGTD